MTHIDNLAQILRDGGLWCKSEVDARKVPHVNIGHGHIKDRRSVATVRVGTGGMVADYVPFYFHPKSPMLYAIMKGRVEGYHGGQEPVVQMCTTAQHIAQRGLPFVFTDRHAVLPYAHQSTDLSELDRLDWRVLRTKYWSEDGDQRERRQAEFLVHRFVPLECISAIGVINAKLAKRVENELVFGAAGPRIEIRPEWYFDVY
jgi:hypothetical protein